MSLGKKIRELRIAKGMTQGDLGSGLVTPSMISQIESDKSKPSYRVLEEIAKKLDAPLEYFLADIELKLEVSTMHKIGKTLLVAEKYEKAIEILEPLLGRISLNLDYDEVKMDLSEVYLATKRHEEAVELLHEMLITAREKENTYKEMIVLNKLGLMEKSRQKTHLAIHYWRTALELFEKLKQEDPFIRSQILMNLGKTHHEIGEFEESLAFFQEAQQLLKRTDKLEHLGLNYMELAISFSQIKKFELATEYSMYAIAIFESLKNRKMMVDAKRNYAILRGAEGCIDEAVHLLSECVNEYIAADMQDEVPFVHGEVARLYLQANRTEDAKTECARGLEYTSPDTLEAAVLYKFQALAEDALGNTDSGILVLVESVRIFEALTMWTELAEALSYLADMYQKRGNLINANECLQRMRKALSAIIQDKRLEE